MSTLLHDDSAIEQSTPEEFLENYRRSQEQYRQRGFTPVQLFAVVRESSKYHSQNEIAREQGYFPIPVTIQPSLDSFVVKGGPGGQYRLEDVDIFVEYGGEWVQITFENPRGNSRRGTRQLRGKRVMGGA